MKKSYYVLTLLAACTLSASTYSYTIKNSTEDLVEVTVHAQRANFSSRPSNQTMKLDGEKTETLSFSTAGWDYPIPTTIKFEIKGNNKTWSWSTLIDGKAVPKSYVITTNEDGEFLINHTAGK